MRPDPCEAFATRLVEFADGELPETEVRVVRDHLSTCAQCRATVEALNRSLVMVRAVWTDAEAGLANAPRAAKREGRRWSLRWAGLAAAGLLLALGAAVGWKSMYRTPPRIQIVENQLTPEQAELLAARAGVSAQMLGAAEYLAENGGADLARERLEYLVSAYPETEAAAVARSRLELERGVR